MHSAPFCILQPGSGGGDRDRGGSPAPPAPAAVRGAAPPQPPAPPPSVLSTPISPFAAAQHQARPGTQPGAAPPGGGHQGSPQLRARAHAHAHGAARAPGSIFAAHPLSFTRRGGSGGGCGRSEPGEWPAQSAGGRSAGLAAENEALKGELAAVRREVRGAGRRQQRARPDDPGERRCAAATASLCARPPACRGLRLGPAHPLRPPWAYVPPSTPSWTRCRRLQRVPPARAPPVTPTALGCAQRSPRRAPPPTRRARRLSC